MVEETFYFCDLKSKDIVCPKMHECKRYELVKDIPYNEYDKLGFARLQEMCEKPTPLGVGWIAQIMCM